MTLEFRDIAGNYLNQWHDMDYIPGICDHVVLYGGDLGRDAKDWVVCWRKFDIAVANKVVLVVEEVEL